MTLPLMHAAGAWPYLAPLWIFFWILVIFLAFRFFFRRRGGWCGPGRGGRGPDEILAERFARGEIDATEYRSRLDTLRQ
jgi:putative membrane protein